MTIKTEILLNALVNRIEAGLSKIHDEALRKFRTLARSVGQRTKTARPSPYPAGEVIGPCVCGSWPGGTCFRCPRVDRVKKPASAPVGDGYDARAHQAAYP